MLRKVMSFRFLIILTMILVVSGCDKKQDEIQELKIQLAETRSDLEHWQRKYEAVSRDNANLRAARRSLGTQLDDIDSSARTVEEQLTVAKQIIEGLQLENEELYADIERQQLILEQQEADLQELLEMLGITTERQVQNGY